MKHVDTIVLVEDIQKSRTFYTEILGLEILHDWEDMIVFRERLAIHTADALQPAEESVRFRRPGKQGQSNLVIYLETEDLDGEYKRLLGCGVDVVHGIVQLPWQRIFRIKDPDGHIIEIGNPF